MLDNPSLSVAGFPNVQFKFLLVQLEAVSSPITCSFGEVQPPFG